MRKLHVIACLFVIPLVLCGAAMAADLEYKAEIQAGEEFNDNVNDTSKPQSDFITVISPKVSANYVGGRITGSVAYQGDLRVYDGGKRQDEILNNLEAKVALELVEKFLLVDATDSNHMVFNNAALGQPTSSDSTRNQVNQNVFSAGVTMTPNIAQRTKTSLGYRASGTVYDSSDDVNKYTQMVFVDVLHELSPKLEIGGNIQAQRQNSDQGDLSRYIGSVVMRYTYGDGRYVFGRFGLVGTVYDVGKSNSLLPTWSGGLTHTLGKTILTLETQADYVDNPSTIYNSYRTTYSGSLTQEFQRARAALTASYSDYSGQGTSHTKEFNAGALVSYELTPRLSATVSGSYVRTMSSSDDLDRLYGSAELRYELPKDFTVKAYYRHKYSLSANVGTSTYNTNIVGIALSKSF